MSTYKVIQDIEAEDKLLGPLTLRQFIYAVIVIVSGFIAFRLAAVKFFLAIPFLPLMIFFGVSQLLEGPRAGVEMVTADLTNRFNIAVAGGNQADAIAVATEMAGIRNGIGTRTPAESRQVVAQMFQDTGLDIGAQESIDEQLGRIIAGQAPTTAAVPGGQGTSAAAQRITNEIRARAGLWDSGARGGGVNPAIIGQGQQQPPQPPPQPPQP